MSLFMRMILSENRFPLFGIMRESYRMLQQRHQPRAVAFQPAGDFEFQ